MNSRPYYLARAESLALNTEELEDLVTTLQKQLARKKRFERLGKQPFEEMMKEWKELSDKLAALESSIIEEYPNEAPRCLHCNTPFHTGGHSSCCGAY